MVEVLGDCACSGNDRVYAYDPLGNLVLEQDARGYITRHTYLGDGRKSIDEAGLRRSDCDPAAYPEDPAACRLSADQLMALGAFDLVRTDASSTHWYAYDDQSWPDRPTQVCQTSVLETSPESERWACRSVTYHSATGEWASIAESGWTGISGDEAALETRSTTRTFYSATDPLPAFDPGGAFDAAWLAVAQPEGMVRAVDGPRSDIIDVTEYVYYPAADVPGAPVPADWRGRLAAERDAEGGITRYSDYDPWGHPRRIVDPGGVTTESTYDAAGRLMTATIVGGAGCDSGADPLCSSDLVTSNAYEPGGGPLESVTSPAGAVSVYDYDSWGRALTIDRGPSEVDLRARQESVYDPTTGLRTRQSLLAYEPGAGWVEHSRTTYGYHPSGQLEVVERPRSASDGAPPGEHFTYDVVGRMSSVQDANHEEPNVAYEYDPLGRLAQVSQLLDPAAPLSERWAVTSYGYDAAGNLTSVTDANDNLTTYVVDDFGQTRRIDSPVTGVTDMSYDPAGNVITRTDARGITTTNTYDAAGRITESRYDDGVSTETISFDYDPRGNRTRAETPDVVQVNTYDRRGQVLTSSLQVDATTYDTSYEYTLDGRLAAVDYPSGRRLEYTVDFAGRPTAIQSTAPGGGASVVLLSDAAYLPSGPPTTLERAPATGQLTEQRGYDWQYRQTGQALGGSLAGTLLDLERTYDPAGNLTAIVDALGDRSATYGYDDMGRLTGAAWASASREYEYDPIGNLERLGVDTGLPGEGEVLFSYLANPSGANSPVLESTATSQGGTPLSDFSVTTDPAGNVTADGQAGYGYGVRNHLASRILGPVVTDHTYSPDGRRVRSTRSDTADTTDVILDPSGKRLARHDASGWRDYVFLGGQLLAYFEDSAADPIQVVSDHIGMPMLAIDATGAIVWQALAEPYGELRGTVEESHDPGLRYPGQWQDELDLEASCAGGECTLPGPLEAGFSLFENGYRWYRPGWGRYTQADPAGEYSLPEGANDLRVIGRHASGFLVEQTLFSYADQAPTSKSDPAGLYTIDKSCSCGIFNEKQTMRAISLVRRMALNGCIARQDIAKCILSNDRLSFICGTQYCKEQGNVYGHTTIGGKVVKLCGLAFDEQARRDRGEAPWTLPAFKGVLLKTVFHEMTHTCGTSDKYPSGEAESITEHAFWRYWSGKCGN